MMVSAVPLQVLTQHARTSSATHQAGGIPWPGEGRSIPVPIPSRERPLILPCFLSWEQSPKASKPRREEVK